LGSFVDHNCQEVLLDLGGCEPTMYNVSGSVLLHAIGSAWRPVKYFPGFESRPCQSLTLADGRERLLCWSHWRTTAGRGTTVFVADLKDEKQVDLIWQGVFDESPTACRDWVEILSVGMYDADGDANADVIVDVNYDASGRQCLTAQRRGKRARLEFIARSDVFAFQPSEPSAEILSFAEPQEKLDPKVAAALRSRPRKRPQPIEPSELHSVSIDGAPR